SPKQLASVGPRGEAILDYSARDARAAGFGPIVLVVRADIEASLSEHVRASWPAAVADEVHYTAQDREAWSRKAAKAGRSKPLGTAHAVVAAATDARLDRPFAVVNADDVYGPEAFALLHAGLTINKAADGLLVAYEAAKTVLGPGPVSRALCDVDRDGRLRAVREGTIETEREGLTWTSGAGEDRRRLRGSELVSMNCWGFGVQAVERLRAAVDRFAGDPANLAGPAEILLPEVVGDLITAEGLVFDVAASSGRCFGLTHAGDLEIVRAQVSEPAW
ncbi:MAG TPA: hypothetical protein VNY84_04415, partial [Acidimicrobiales bacterium]|nr:hypothetical protein [Acidimicrobiales bacterium]